MNIRVCLGIVPGYTYHKERLLASLNQVTNQVTECLPHFKYSTVRYPHTH